MSIYIVRHAETDGNAGGVIQTSDTPLNARGLQQAEALAGRLARDGVARILASDLARAEMTAEAVQRGTGAPIGFDPRLRERDFGDWRGRSHEEVPHFLEPHGIPPNGEDWETFHVRVADVWEHIARLGAETAGNLVVVTHGLVCFSLALHHLSLPPGVEAGLGFTNTSVTVAEARSPWAVSTWNSDTHLEGDLAPRGRVS